MTVAVRTLLPLLLLALFTARLVFTLTLAFDFVLEFEFEFGFELAVAGRCGQEVVVTAFSGAKSLVGACLSDVVAFSSL